MLQRLLALLRRIFGIESGEDRNVTSLYLHVALQYHVAGRSAFFADSFPVSGNLFHHAIEMMLKYSLMEKDYSPQSLRMKYRHDLKTLWREYKKTSKNGALAAYDSVINRLNPVEELRYPWRSYIFTMGLRKGPDQPFTGPATRGIKQYHLTVEEVDELMSALLLANDVNPEWVKGRLRGEATEQYQRENFHRFI